MLSSVYSDLKLQKAKKKLLFTNKLAVTIDHVIALLFNVSSRPVPLLTNVRRNSQVRIISLVQEKNKYITDFHFLNLFRSVPVPMHAQ